ncbi:DUF1840 domain-containing protein [Ideonella dechloratans]|uniref:DUF1840 domain-containing protein n=1 Tax=Ideonella dechloratans TaxID=36863 RepID=UPI0035AE3BAA
MYKFRSQAAADLIMLTPTGDRVLALLGREPASRGIIEVADMAQAIERLSAAVAADEAARQQASAEEEGGEAHRPAEAVSLRQRVWPLIQMLRSCQAADEPIVWGV